MILPTTTLPTNLPHQRTSLCCYVKMVSYEKDEDGNDIVVCSGCEEVV